MMSRRQHERTNRGPMKAAVCTGYGPPEVLRIRDVRKPVPEGRRGARSDPRHDGERGRLRAAAIRFCPLIWVPMRLAFGIRRPRRPVLGQELAGDVEAVGRKVTSLKEGDRVFAATGVPLGAHAEYICLRENPRTGAITTMPANLDYRGGRGHSLRRRRGPASSCGRRTSAAGSASSSTGRVAASARMRSSSPRTSGDT